jgi:hypothetical protein
MFDEPKDAPETIEQPTQPAEQEPVLNGKGLPAQPPLPDNIRALREKIERDAKELEQMRKERDEARRQIPSQAQDSQDDSRLRQLEAQVIETRLRSQYPDFDKVVNADNIAVLQAKHPELTAAITLTPGKDIYATAAAAYTLIRKLGIAPEDEFVEDKAIAQKNAAKPRPLSSMSPQSGDSPLAHANAFSASLTSERKAQVWKQMQEDMKQG